MSRAIHRAPPVDAGAWVLLQACGFAGVVMLLGLAAALLVGAVTSDVAASAWAAPVLGTLAVASVGVGLAVPLGVAVAVAAREYALPGRGRPIRALVRVMLGVPPIVYGLFGAATFVAVFGPGPVAAGATLGVLALPSVAASTDEALAAVDPGLRRAARALGATRFQVVWRVVMPQAAGGIARGALVAVAYCVGQTAPLLVTGAAVAASGEELVTLSTLLYDLSGDAPGQQAFLVALLLAVVSAGARLGADRLVRPREVA